MTLAKFIKELEKIVEKDNQFIVYTNKNDKSFKKLKNNEMVICGEDENEVFAIHIIKVEGS